MVQEQYLYGLMDLRFQCSLVELATYIVACMYLSLLASVYVPRLQKVEG